MKEIRDLKDLFFHELQLLWSAEKLLVDAVPAMIEKAHNEELKDLLFAHHAETREHKKVLEAICRQLGVDLGEDANPGIRGILDEGNKLMAKDVTPEGLDAALIAGAQKLEHYEISSYGSAAHYADMLGYDDIATQLRETLGEEQQADTKLNFLAKNLVNLKANIPTGISSRD